MTSPNAITAFQDAYVEKLVDTLNDLPNVLWGTSEESVPQSNWWNNHQIDHIKAYEATKPLQHPVGYGTFINTSDSQMTTTNADWMAPLSRISASTSCGSGTPACKVNINDSDHGYFGLWNDTAQQNRNYIWENFTQGSQVLFMDPYLVYYPRDNRNDCGNPVNGICSTPDSKYDNFRVNLGYTRRYADRVNLLAMTPQGGKSSTGNVLANTSTTQSEFLVYAPSGGSFTVNLSHTNRSLKVEWFNPATGVATSGSAVTGGSSAQSFTTPFTGDAVLYIYDASLGGADVASPTTPSGLIATPVSSTQINLAWTASSDNVGVAGYTVFRGGVQIATTATNSYQDTGLSASTGYSYTVLAFDAAGNASAQSAPVGATTQASSDTAAPTVPTGLTATAASSTSVTLSWTASTDNVGVTGYKVYRNGVQVTTTASVGCADTGLTAGTTYSYKVAAFDAAANTSAQSQAASATTLPASTMPAFVQQAYAVPRPGPSTVTVTYTNAQVAGDLNIVAIGFNNTTSTITSVTDTKGNVYLAAAPLTRGAGVSQAIYYAKNIAGAAGGSNTVTVTFNIATALPDVRISEYSGLDVSNPLDKTASAVGNSDTASTAAVTTGFAKELIYAAGMTTGGFNNTAAGFTTRVITSPNLDIGFDENVSAIGSYNASAGQSGGSWVLQMVTFKATGQ